MINPNSELVSYRLSRAKETFEEAKLLAQENHWNAVANRLYYSCYYAVNALLIKHRFSFSSHNGVKTEFYKSFVKTGNISIESGKLYNRLFNLRQEGDYVDFQRFTQEDIEPFLDQAENFIREIKKLIV